MFHDRAKFTFTDVLESHWTQIRAEYLAIRERLEAWPETKLYGSGWSVFGLFDFPGGEPIPENMGACPVTAELIQKHIPNHGAAGFSVMAPGTHIKPHVGYAGDYLRCHLPLIVPAGNIGLKVGAETMSWVEGRALVFDDRVEHEAWNRAVEASAERVVLLIDFVPAS